MMTSMASNFNLSTATPAQSHRYFVAMDMRDIADDLKAQKDRIPSLGSPKAEALNTAQTLLRLHAQAELNALAAEQADTAATKADAWSDFTGREEPCGFANGYPMVAREHADGTWSWHGFGFPTLDDARAAARKAGY